jgi:hypothetical protein
MANFSQDGLPVEIVKAGEVAPGSATTLSPSLTSRVTIYQFTAWLTTGTGTIVLSDGANTFISKAMTTVGDPIVYNWPNGVDLIGLRVQGTVNPTNIKYSIKAKSTAT